MENSFSALLGTMFNFMKLAFAASMYVAASYIGAGAKAGAGIGL